MKRGLIAGILLCSLLLVSCSEKLKADLPDAVAGVGRAVPTLEEEIEEEENIPWADALSAQPEQPLDSEAPFYKIEWKIDEDGNYIYQPLKRDNSGMATMGEMESFSRARLPDAHPADEEDGWFMGQMYYDEASGEAYPGSYDRWDSTKEILAKYGAVYRGDETRKVCYLTFDCGYEKGSTGRILDTLKEKKVPGTFFLTGSYIRSEPELVARMLDEGHVVGNHTNTHPVMPDLSVDEVLDELTQVEKSFREAFPDAADMLYFRPPTGACTEWLFKIAAKLGYRTVLWSYGYYDWSEYWQPTYEEGLASVKSGLHPGCVYLLHAESATNADILPEFIDWIRAQGYEILPMCDIPAW